MHVSRRAHYSPLLFTGNRYNHSFLQIPTHHPRFLLETKRQRTSCKWHEKEAERIHDSVNHSIPLLLCPLTWVPIHYERIPWLQIPIPSFREKHRNQPFESTPDLAPHTTMVNLFNPVFHPEYTPFTLPSRHADKRTIRKRSVSHNLLPLLMGSSTAINSFITS